MRSLRLNLLRITADWGDNMAFDYTPWSTYFAEPTECEPELVKLGSSAVINAVGPATIDVAHTSVNSRALGPYL